jgi:hypothetical protein
VGLDVYVGPLTRYGLGDWLTIVQQIGRDRGISVQVDRHGAEPRDSIIDPVQMLAVVREWQTGLGQALGCQADWPEDATLPYWTDKPDWDGYGSLLLLAAYDERPDLRPDHADAPGRQPAGDQPRAYEEAPAYQAASAQPHRYPSLLRGAEWWLPLPDRPPLVFTAPQPSGQRIRIGRVDRLLAELRLLSERSQAFATDDRQAVRSVGPPPSDAPIEVAARFGLAIMFELAQTAAEHRQPLLIDY